MIRPYCPPGKVFVQIVAHSGWISGGFYLGWQMMDLSGVWHWST